MPVTLLQPLLPSDSSILPLYSLIHYSAEVAEAAAAAAALLLTRR